RAAAPGRGAVMVLETWAELSEANLKDRTVVVQGFGQVGSWIARLIPTLGCRVVGLSDVRGGIYNSAGLDVEAVYRFSQQHGTLVGFPGAEAVSNEDVLTLPCDILAPAAIDRVLNHRNAHAVRASLVLEGANHPTTPAADAILAERGVTVLPDILVNAGGVVVSYFEWAQNLQEFRWPEERVNGELRQLMVKSTREVVQQARDEHCSLREAAFRLAVQRVAKAIQLRGFV
ncbi:MAG: glutamate dehydrogenase, partial [SAR202 cluster bacterium]|nr:glutamate dehydrogenase [SAR202 cluster bacterium]